MANQLLARLGIVLGVDSAELVTGLNAAKEKFTGFTKEVQRQSNEAAKMTMALKMATESYGKTLTAVEKVEMELTHGRLAGAKISDVQLKLLRDQAKAYDAVAAAAAKANTAQGKGMRADLQAALAYQTTDVITGLAGGQNPFMVLLQQGGQLRDQFGGFKPMFEGIASVLTAARVAAAGFAGALATLGYAMYKGAEEQKAFNNMLVLTGGYLNMTEASFTALSVSIGNKYHTSISDVRGAMQQLASTGQFTSATLSSVTGLVARMSRLTGESAATIATSLIPALDGSASSAKKLNDQYHFLTVEQYTHIRQLAAQGKQQESILYTTELLTKSLNRQTSEAGLLEKAWRGITGAMGEFWQSLKDVGKTPDLEQQVRVAWNAVGIAARRAESENATALDKQMLQQAQDRYEKVVAALREHEAEKQRTAKEAADNQRKIDYQASGRAAKDRQLRYQAEDFDEAARAAARIQSLDKISAIEEKRVKDRDAAIRAAKRANEDEDFAHTAERAKTLAAQLRSIDAAAAREKMEVYASAREAYRTQAQAQQDEVDREKERIAFYREHLFLQGTDLEIALTRLKTEQEIQAIYDKKDSGLKADKDAAAERLRAIQAQREANIQAGVELKMLQDMNTAVYNNMSSALENFVRTGKLSFKDFARSVIQDLIAIAMKAQMMSLFKGFNFFNSVPTAATAAVASSMGGDSLDNMLQLTGAFGTAQRANGGSVTGGSTYLVGENGPELFTSNTSGTIIPNGQVGAALNAPSGPVFNGPYIANLSAIDTQSGIQFLAKNKQAVWAASQSAQRALPASR
jgi:phage-related minor tail protein